MSSASSGGNNGTTITAAATATSTVIDTAKTAGLNRYVVASDHIPTTSCGRFTGDDDAGGGGGSAGAGGNGIISAESTSSSSSSGLMPVGVMPVEGTTNAGISGDDLGPVSRDRCNTWPLRRPQLDINAQTSPLIHEQIPEEETDLYDSVENVSNGRLGANSTATLMGSPESGAFSPGIPSPVPCRTNLAGAVGVASTPSDISDSGVAPPNKKSTTRRNAWGNMSYADLITQAIVSSPEKRLTLSQVYEWMVQNVPYFRDKGDSNSSAGWKYIMEVTDAELDLEDYAEFEQRGRSHTWPAQQFVHLDSIGTTVSTAKDPCITPSVSTPAIAKPRESNSSTTSSSMTLAQALQTNLDLSTESSPIRELHSVPLSPKHIPARAQSTVDVSVPEQSIKSNAATSYPSLAQLLLQSPNRPTFDSGVPLTHSPQVAHSDPVLSVDHQPATSNSSTQQPAQNLSDERRTTSSLLSCVSSSGVSSGSQASQIICAASGSVQTMVVPLDPRTASDLPSTVIITASPSSAIQSLSSSNVLLSGTTISATDMSVNITDPQTQTAVPPVVDLDDTVPYFVTLTAPEGPVIDDPEDPGEEKPVKKKRIRKRPNGISQKKPNPWGEESYSDLIAKALESAADGRMRLNEIYNWFATNVAYFANRTSQEESAGWKNSIRHNLSLHSRFMRIQNEGAGKSSWWVINPDAKPGRNPRRQRSATLETTTKVSMDKKRRGARKKVMEMRAGGVGGSLHSAGSSVVGSQASMLSRELYDNDDSLNFEPFRPRTQSNLSLSGSSSRVSPSVMENYENFESFDFPPFVEAAGVMPHDILDRTNEMNLNQSDSPAFHRPMANPMLNGTSAQVSANLVTQIKSEPSSSRTENGVQPPPSYHELNVVRGVQNIQNPLLRTHLIQNRIPNQPGVSYNGTYSSGNGGVGISNWMQSSVAPVGIHPSVSCAAQQTFSGYTAALPMDLENLALPDQPLMEVENMEAVIRHELSQSTGSQLSFDNI